MKAGIELRFDRRYGWIDGDAWEKWYRVVRDGECIGRLVVYAHGGPYLFDVGGSIVKDMSTDDRKRVIPTCLAPLMPKATQEEALF